MLQLRPANPAATQAPSDAEIPRPRNLLLRNGYLLTLLLATAPTFANEPDPAAAMFRHEAELGKIQEARKNAEKALAAQYAAALKAQQAKAQGEGNLDKVKAILAEAARFESERTAPTTPLASPDLQIIATTFEKRLREIETKEAGDLLRQAAEYDAELAALQIQLTKAGKFDQAGAVQEERKKAAASESIARAKELVSSAPGKPPSVALPTPPAAPWNFPPMPLPNATGWITVFDGRRLQGCSPSRELVSSGKISLEDGVLRLDQASLAFDITARDVAVRVRLKKVSGQNCSVTLRSKSGLGYVGWFNGGRSFGIGKHSGGYSDLRGGSSGQNFSDYFDLEFSAEAERLTLQAEGKTVVAVESGSIKEPGRVTVSAHKGITLIKRIEIRNLDPKK